MSEEQGNPNLEQRISNTSKRFIELLRKQGQVVAVSEHDFKANPNKFLKTTDSIAVTCVGGDQRSPELSSWLQQKGYSVVTPRGSSTMDLQDRGRFEVLANSSGHQLTFEQGTEKKPVNVLILAVRFIPEPNATFSEGDNILASAATLLSGKETGNLQILLVDTEQ
jgi:hypothetical protein